MSFKSKNNYNYLLVDVIDGAFLSFYKNVINNSRRLTKLLVAVLPLMTLLVGSCKTAELPLAYTGIGAGFSQHFVADNLLTSGSVNGNIKESRVIVANNNSRTWHLSVTDPRSLLNLTQKEVSNLFGKPSFARKDATARVWQYKTSSCVVDFYFYEENSTKGNNPVSYVDMRFKEELLPGSPSRTTPASYQEQSRCLNEVVAKRSSSKSHA